MTPEEFAALLGNTKLTAKGITTAQGFGVEFLLGFVLVLVVFAVCDPNRPECKYAAPLAIGLTVALGHLATVSIADAVTRGVCPSRSAVAAAARPAPPHVGLPSSRWAGAHAGKIMTRSFPAFGLMLARQTWNVSVPTIRC